MSGLVEIKACDIVFICQGLWRSRHVTSGKTAETKIGKLKSTANKIMEKLENLI